VAVLLGKSNSNFKSVARASSRVGGVAVLPILLEDLALGVVGTLVEVLARGDGSDNVLHEHAPAVVVVITIETIPALAGIIVDVTVRTPHGELVAGVELVEISLSLVGTSKSTGIRDPLTKEVVVVGGKKVVHVLDELESLGSSVLDGGKILGLDGGIEVVETKSELVGENVHTEIDNIVAEGINLGSAEGSNVVGKKELPGVPEVVKTARDATVGDGLAERIDAEGVAVNEIVDLRNILNIADVVGRSAEDDLLKDHPSVLDFAALADGLTITTLDVVIEPLTRRDGLIAPALLEHSLVHDVVLADGFHSDTDTVHSVVAALTTVEVRLSKDVRKITPHTRVATKVVKHAPDPLLAVVVVLAAEDGAVLSEQVEEDHTVIGHTRKVSLDLRLLPEGPFVDEEPGLHEPDGIRITRDKTLISTTRALSEVGGVVGGRLHLVVHITVVDVVGAVGLGLDLDVTLAELVEERISDLKDPGAVLLREASPVGSLGDLSIRIVLLDAGRNVTGEHGENRSHTELTHTGKDEKLHVVLSIDPSIAERTSPGLNVTHTEPGKEGRASEVGVDFLVSKTELLEKSTLDVLLTSESKRKVDTLKCHPIDLALPASPIPPGSTVGNGAHIHVVTPLISSDNADLSANKRKALGVHGRGKLITSPAELNVGVVLHVVAETSSKRNTIVTADDDGVCAIFKLKHIMTIVSRVDNLKRECVNKSRETTLNESLNGFNVVCISSSCVRECGDHNAHS